MAPTRRLRFALATEAVESIGSEGTLHVLDAGCGDGLFAEALARRNPSWIVVGADSSAESLALARRRAAQADIRNLTFVRADLTRDLGAGKYDAITAIECLVDIEDDQGALEMMGRALRPNGIFVTHVPEEHWKPVLWRSARTWRHQVRQGYTSTRLWSQLDAAGFTILEIRPTCHVIVRLAQDVRDLVKAAPVWLRALVFPLMAASVWLERWGVRLGRERALFAVARKSP